MIKTYAVADIAADLCGDSLTDPVRWLTRQITSGRITARRVGRQWRMTQADIDAALEVFANRAPATAPTPTADTIAEPISIARPSAASLRRRMAVAR